LVTATPEYLWPPNHTYRDISLTINAVSECPLLTYTATVVSNEPDNATGNGNGNGNTIGDMEAVKENKTILLSSNAAPMVRFDPIDVTVII